VKHFLAVLTVIMRKVGGKTAYICWGMIEKEVEDNGESVHDDTKDVTPSPLQLGVQI
jgi:hypothetical protein